MHHTTPARSRREGRRRALAGLGLGLALVVTGLTLRGAHTGREREVPEPVPVTVPAPDSAPDSAPAPALGRVAPPRVLLVARAAGPGR